MGTDGWGGAGGDWVLEVLGVLWGTTGYYQVPLGSVKYCWVFLGYWVVLRGIGGRGAGVIGDSGALWTTLGHCWVLLGTGFTAGYLGVMQVQGTGGYPPVPPEGSTEEYSVILGRIGANNSTELKRTLKMDPIIPLHQDYFEQISLKKI